jgi:hypothetical protein
VAGRKLEVGAQLVDHIKGVQTSMFSPGGALVVGQAGDDAETTDPVFGIKTFKHPGRGANTVFVGAVTHCNTTAREDGLGNCLAIIREGEVMEHPSSASGALLEALAEGKCRRRDGGCLGAGTSVAEVGGMTKDGCRLEVSGRR